MRGLIGCLVCGASAALALVLLWPTIGLAADAPKLSVGLGYHFSSGKYGTSSTTEIGYIPLAFKLATARWALQATVPYLRISGPPGVVQGPNGVVQTVGGESDGLGDILGRASYTIWPHDQWFPWVEFIGRVKFPSASRHDGLGTGKFDYGTEIELSWNIGKLTPFVGGGYRFLGSPPGFVLSDVFVGSGGAMYHLSDSLNAGVFIDYRESPSASSGERLDLIPFVTWKLERQWSVDTYVSAGLAKGSPDVGTGMQLTYTLPDELLGSSH